ncbi:MAG: transposase [Holophagales bacterium]|nr:transposase [Holophagales bacterium]
MPRRPSSNPRARDCANRSWRSTSSSYRVDWLCRKLFGKSSEKVDPSQLALAFEQLAVEDAAAGAADGKAPEEDGPVETDSGEPRGRGKKKGHGRGALPANLPRRRVVIEVPAQERACSCCQREMTPSARTSSSRWTTNRPGSRSSRPCA